MTTRDAVAVDLQFTPLFDQPGIVDIVNAGDGSGRLFLVAKSGQVLIVKNRQVLGTPFLDISGRTRSSGSEQGLLSLTFAPDFASSGLLYAWYTNGPGNMVLSRFEVGENPDVANAGSEEILLVVNQPFSNHNGGELLFGPDGKLYLGTGDGGSANDPQDNGQALDTLLGKVIRIDVSPQHDPYGIPPDNPFVGNPGARDEIWAYGLRNPWRMAFDPANGDLFIADVGQGEIEEIDHQPANSGGGENYGWNIMEGNQCFSANNCDQSGLTLPVAQYDHTRGCSVTGGEVYRGTAYPALDGVYLYGDFCTGRIWGLSRDGSDWNVELLANTTFNIVTFGAGEDGSIYLSDAEMVYLVSDGEPLPAFAINAGLNDAWVSANAPLQGFFFTVLPVQGLVFLSWFTFDSESSDDSSAAVFGAVDQRWITGLGAFSGNAATIDVELTSGGVFNAPVPLATQQQGYGTVTVTFLGCNSAVLTYEFPGPGLSGQIALARALPENTALCESLRG